MGLLCAKRTPYNNRVFPLFTGPDRASQQSIEVLHRRVSGLSGRVNKGKSRLAAYSWLLLKSVHIAGGVVHFLVRVRFPHMLLLP